MIYIKSLKENADATGLHGFSKTFIDKAEDGWKPILNIKHF